jgi:hypothetical protein
MKREMIELEKRRKKKQEKWKIWSIDGKLRFKDNWS